ncbi:hypothetical protein AB0G88_41895, partial [Streptomyces noursei]
GDVRGAPAHATPCFLEGVTLSVGCQPLAGEWGGTPELNPVEPLWSSLKKREFANLAGDHLADVADATEQGIHRINQNQQLPWSFLTHTGLTIHPPTPPNQRKDQ